jgi:lysophospholipase L1-like esterase
MRTRTTVIFLLAGWVLLVASLVGGRTLALEVADPDPKRFAQEINRFVEWDAKNAVPRDGVLFVGSSSIRMWKSSVAFPNLPIINRGFGGAHLSDVLHYFDVVVKPYHPKLIVLYAGDNDVAGKKDAARVLADYQRFVKLVETHVPGAKIIFLAIKPSLSRWTKWGTMAQANAAIRSYSMSKKTLFYADVASPMIGKDGKPRPELFVKDGLHLNTTGYELWTKVLGPAIEVASR